MPIDSSTLYSVSHKSKSSRGNSYKRFLPIHAVVCPAFNIDRGSCEQPWRQAVYSGKENGFRNAQVTVLAPTGTIGFMMDCDTTGIEPMLAVVSYKKLVGGGVMTIANGAVTSALTRLGYPHRCQRQGLPSAVRLQRHDQQADVQPRANAAYGGRQGKGRESCHSRRLGGYEGSKFQWWRMRPSHPP